MENKYLQYLEAVKRPFKKIAKLEFLQPNGAVAFALNNKFNRLYRSYYDTRAFLQDGTLNVSLQNGQRRKASVTLANIDDAFAYSVNKIWFGQQVRLSMGIELPDGSDFYLPQGVFYIENPQAAISPTQRTISYNLVDKWAYLDGTLFGKISNTYKIPTSTEGQNTNIFNAMGDLLRLSKYDFPNTATDITRQIDYVTPVFTTYYNGRSYDLYGGGTALMTDVPYDVVVQAGGTFADILLELNQMLAGWIGYDQTGALRVDSSQNDIVDVDKPILWHFEPKDGNLLDISETANNGSVYNQVIIAGEGMEDYEIYGIASNYDPKSNTNINLIGKRPFYEAKPSYWNAQQCVDLAEFYLKRKTVLEKSITVTSTQLFHLLENRLISIKRTDKSGSPTEKHVIQSYSLPIGESGAMTINCVSVNDYPIISTNSSING